MLNNLLYSALGAVVDIVALTVLVFLTALGAVRGFTKTFISVFGVLISLILSALLCSTMALFMESKFSLITSISNGLSGILNGIFGDELMNVPLSMANEELLNGNIALWLASIILSAKDNPNISQTTTLNQIVSPVFAYYVAVIISFIVLYIIFRVILFLIGELVKRAHNIVLVKKVDCSLGAVLGFVRAFIIIGITVAIIRIIPIGFVQDFVIVIDNTILTRFCSTINIGSVIINLFANVNIGGIIEKVLAHW